MVKSYYGIIVTHGSLGQELIKTAEMIVGKSNNIEAISNNGLSLQGLTDKVEKAVLSIPDKNVVVFSEMKGGSPYIASRKIEKKYNNVLFISGVNIPMLISFITKNENLKTGQLMDVLKEDAIRGIEAI